MATIFYGAPLEAFPVTPFNEWRRSPVTSLPVSPALTVKSAKQSPVPVDDDYEMTRSVTGYARCIEKKTVLGRVKSIFKHDKKPVGLGIQDIAGKSDVEFSKSFGTVKRGCKSSLRSSTYK